MKFSISISRCFSWYARRSGLPSQCEGSALRSGLQRAHTDVDDPLPRMTRRSRQFEGRTPLRVIGEAGRQATRRRPSIRWSTGTVWFQVANVRVTIIPSIRSEVSRSRCSPPPARTPDNARLIPPCCLFRLFSHVIEDRLIDDAKAVLGLISRFASPEAE